MFRSNARSARQRAEMKAVTGSRFPIVRVGLALVAAVSTVSALVTLSTL